MAKPPDPTHMRAFVPPGVWFDGHGNIIVPPDEYESRRKKIKHRYALGRSEKYATRAKERRGDVKYHQEQAKKWKDIANRIKEEK